jgi:hypothetical protein
LETGRKYKILSLLLAVSIFAGTLFYNNNISNSTVKADTLQTQDEEVNSADNESGEDADEETVQEDTTVPPQNPGQAEGTANHKDNRPMIVQNPNGVIDDHELIAQNGKLEMYFKEDTLSIIIRDKKTGAVMYSTVSDPDPANNNEWQNFMRSGVVVEYLQGTNVVVYRADLLSNNPKKSVEFNSNGFTAKVEHPELKIEFEFSVALTEDGFTAEIPQDKLKDTDERYKIAGFYVYPFLGYSKLAEREGYMLIPDGQGALIHLKDNNGKFKQPFSEMVYGSNAGIDDPFVLSLFNGHQPVKDPEKVLAPVYGMVHTDSGFGYLAIIEEGDFNARIEAYPSGAVTPYNWISSRFIYRQFYNQFTSKNSGTRVVRQPVRNNFNIKIRYKFVSEDEANYTGLAKKFRQYLLENEVVMQRDSDFKVRVDFLGGERENWLMFKKLVPMTTTRNVDFIINNFKEQGVNNILSIYKGWQKGGIYGGLPTNGYNVEKGLGGRKGLNKLMEEMKNSGVSFYIAQDTLRINPSENKNASFNIIKKFNLRDYEEEVFGKVYRAFNFLLPNKTAEIMRSNKASYSKNNVENIMISGITNNVFSYSYKGSIKDRFSTKTVYEDAISDYYDEFNLLLEQPFSYLWKYTEAIIDMPIESSNYVFTDEEIPFLSIALKGILPMYSKYVNFHANQREAFLKLVEQGVYPSFLNTYEDPSKLLYTNSSGIFSSRYDRYTETIETYYKELLAVNSKLKNAVIEEHKRVDEVAIVKYSNGVTIYVNYNENPVTVDGITIGAKSYKVDDAI